MLRKLNSLFILAFVLVLATGLSGCAKQSTTIGTSGTGVVTESTLTDTVESSGSLQAAQVATLTWYTSGVVSTVNVESGDIVSDDDVLMELDSTTVPAEVINAFVELAKARLALEDAKSMSSTAQAAVDLAEAQDLYNESYSDYYMIGKTIGSNISIKAAENALEQANVILARASKRVTKLSYLQDTDLAKLEAIEAEINAQQNVNTLMAQINYLKSTPDATVSALYDANFQLAKAQLESAQRAYDRVKDGPNVDDIAVAQAAVDAAQATVNSMKIIAPFDGEVVLLYNQVGDQINENENALILVNRETMYVEVAIDETSISNVSLGDTATISFDAFPGKETTGKVTFINPIGSSSSGVVNYTVRVTLDKADTSVLIGATATIVIQTGEPQTSLFVPITAVQTDAQGEYVTRVVNGKEERVSVVSGQISGNTVLVAGDLKAGDIVKIYSTLATSDSNSEEDSRNQMGPGSGIPGGGLMP